MREQWTRGSMRGVLMLLGACLLLVGPVHGGPFTGIVSFADSLSDLGNYSQATGGISPPALYGYDAGRFTNGPIWLEYLAKDLGLPAPTASANGGTDYAYGGATTGTGNTTLDFLGGSASVPNMGQQVTDYLAHNTPTANQLFTLWGGANDFFHAGVTDPTVPVSNLATEITQLAQAGARQFLLVNLPLLGNLPSTKSLPATLPQELNQLPVGFNMALSATATGLEKSLGIRIGLVDVYSLVNDAEANPSKYGFTNVTDMALGTGSDGTGYLSWDGVLPTTQAARFIGDLASAASVPEPSSLLMLGTALLVIGRLARRPRARAARS